MLSSGMLQLATSTHLSLMVFVLFAVVEDTVTLPTEIATTVTQNQGLCLSIIMVITQRLNWHNKPGHKCSENRAIVMCPTHPIGVLLQLECTGSSAGH